METLAVAAEGNRKKEEPDTEAEPKYSELVQEGNDRTKITKTTTKQAAPHRGRRRLWKIFLSTPGAYCCGTLPVLFVMHSIDVPKRSTG